MLRHILAVSIRFWKTANVVLETQICKYTTCNEQLVNGEVLNESLVTKRLGSLSLEPHCSPTRQERDVQWSCERES